MLLAPPWPVAVSENQRGRVKAHWLKMKGCPKVVASDLHKFQEERNVPKRAKGSPRNGRCTRVPLVCAKEKLPKSPWSKAGVGWLRHLFCVVAGGGGGL